MTSFNRDNTEYSIDLETSPKKSYRNKMNRRKESSPSKIISSIPNIEERFMIDKNQNMNKNKSTNGAMRTILPRNQTYINPNTNKITSSYVSFKQKDLVEWNKYLTHKNIYGEMDFSDFVFEDKELYKTYVDLCTKRDSIPECSAIKIEELKKQDPVFSKRYRQYIFAKSCNRAPQFDTKDFFVRPIIPKYTLQKKKQEIINENINNLNRSKKLFEIEMNMIREKTQEFLRNIPA